jgi:predicted ABC-type ATPase
VPKQTGTALRGIITVLAGVNGAGKSSIAGSFIRQAGGDYYNPDEFTRSLLHQNPGLDPAEANSLAWLRGKELLEHAVAAGTDFVFETTLGARTIPQLLARAAREGMAVKIFFVGLESVEHHLRRVTARVADGGHDIPEAKIRERWENSRLNVIRLLPDVVELMVWDNSVEVKLARTSPEARLLLHVVRGKVTAPKDLSGTPAWAKPIVAAALRLQRSEVV